MKNIVLIGMPGSGKSTVGKKLAKQTGMEFVDMDEMIEEREGTTISEMFANKGEPYFRDLETQIAKEVSERTDTIISAGGGIIVREENMRALSAGGIIVFIDRDPNKIAKQIKTGKRPLLNGDPNRVFELYDQRIHLYRKYADHTIRRKKKQAAADQLESLVNSVKEPMKLAVIGDPIEHSMSPDIHLPVLQRFNKDTIYERIHVKQGELESFIETVKQADYRGFNITMPHKKDIMPFLDEIDPDAAFIDAVNTVVNDNGKLIGYNTDGIGFVMMVEETGFRFKDKNIVVFGAGGAASAVTLKIASLNPAKITILDIVPDNAQRIKEKIAAQYPDVTVRIMDMTIDQMKQACKDTDILINGTPVGMAGFDDFESFEFLDELPEQAMVCDLIYHPMMTNLLTKADEKGHPYRGGIGMLLYQALVADEYYLNFKINMEAMREHALSAIKGKVNER